VNDDQVLLLPTIFERLNEKTLYIFGAVNVFSIAVVWAFYPETNQRTLEEMDLVFASDSIWTWEAEKNFALLKEENPELIQAAKRGQRVVDPETRLSTSRRPSTAAGHHGSLTVRNLSNAGQQQADMDEKSVVEHK
jgi:hypothetical protein